MQKPKNLNSKGHLRVEGTINDIITDLQALTKILRPISRAACETNIALTNKMLLSGARDSFEVIKELLAHLVHISELKGVMGTLVVMMTKLIGLTKIVIENHQDKRGEGYSTDMEFIIKHLMDVTFILSNKTQQQDMILRIIQITYSLIEPELLRFADYGLITRMYSVCFNCCLSTPTILSISVGALFSLTGIVFANSRVDELLGILVDFLELVLHNKKSNWAKDVRLKCIIWEIIVIAIRQYPKSELDRLVKNVNLIKLLNEMYVLSVEFCFKQKIKQQSHFELFRQTIRCDYEKVHNVQKLEPLKDFVKVYEAFVYFSIHLSIKSQQMQQIVPFKRNLDIFHVIYDLQVSKKLYIYLEGISLILYHGSNLIFEEHGGILLIDIFKKVSEQLYNSKAFMRITWEGNDHRLQRPFADYDKITDQQFIRLVKTTIVTVRKKMEENLSNFIIEEPEQNNEISQSVLKQDVSNHGKSESVGGNWKRLIKSITRIIRFLTSLGFKDSSNDQVIRKFLMELQFWFVICPNTKTRNIVLQELQHSVLHIDNRYQAIKASQCLQICSNIIYGFYGRLNSVSVSIIAKMLAYAKIMEQDGKGFDELDEVCEMADKFYIEQKIIDTEQAYIKTVNGLIESANIFFADMQLPIQNANGAANSLKRQEEKYIRLIDYVLVKLKFVIVQNSQFLMNQWNFITCFWVSFCSCKNQNLRLKTVGHVWSVVLQLQRNGMVRQVEIMSMYNQLARLHLIQVSKAVVTQVKGLVINMREEQGLIGILSIIKQIRSSKQMISLREQVFQLQEMFVKQSLYKITSQQFLLKVIDFVQFDNKGKNEEYCTISLLWNISDHIKSLNISEPTKIETIWRHLFKKIIVLAKVSSHSQTKNSCMHSFTQVLAECNQFFSSELLSKILIEDYTEMLKVLLGFDQNQQIFDNVTLVQMQKAAIKNFVKLSKKCLNNGKGNIQEFFKSVNESIMQNFQKQQKQFSIQYLFELCILLNYYREIVSQFIKDEKILNIELIKNILTSMELRNQKLDKGSYLYKKKYQPEFLEVKSFFDNL